MTILQAAAPDGIAADSADGRVTGALIKRGYLISLPRDDQPSLLIITAEGRVAAGLPAPANETAVDPPKGQEQQRPNKATLLRALLERPQGATVGQMTEATGWQAHSVRGFISGTLKKKLGLVVQSDKTDGGRVYRIAASAG